MPFFTKILSRYILSLDAEEGFLPLAEEVEAVLRLYKNKDFFRKTHSGHLKIVWAF